jgi:hypothetical protein
LNKKLGGPAVVAVPTGVGGWNNAKLRVRAEREILVVFKRK